MSKASSLEHPAPELETLPMLEAWRGVAAALVVLAHWGSAAGWRDPLTAFAFTGVDLFFVISGFVFAPYVTGHASLEWRAFGIRRVTRLWPAYMVALGLYAALAAAADRPLLYLPEHALMAHVQSREVAFYYNPAFWSLPAEVEFYALVGLMGTLASPALLQRAWPWMLAVAALLRLALIPAADIQNQNMAYLLVYHLPGLLVEFLLGVWAWRLHRAQIGRKDQAARLRAGLLLGLLGMVVCTTTYAWLGSGPAGSTWLHGQLSLGLAACFAPVLAATAGLRPRAGAIQATCAWSGRLSYPIYLLHSALTPLATGAVNWSGLSAVGGAALPPAITAVVALLAGALALHLLVEEPARRWGRRVALELHGGRPGH